MNPAVKHKTRGNAALCIHAECDPEEAFELACEEVDTSAEVTDSRTNPGVVVAPGTDVSSDVAAFSRAALTDFHEIDAARELAEQAG
ncbi:tRNA(Ile2) 2-agmatinylcytidine synthetase, partial [Enterococcus hirae]